jgi:hypothetical protein
MRDLALEAIEANRTLAQEDKVVVVPEPGPARRRPRPAHASRHRFYRARGRFSILKRVEAPVSLRY